MDKRWAMPLRRYSVRAGAGALVLLVGACSSGGRGTAELVVPTPDATVGSQGAPGDGDKGRDGSPNAGSPTAPDEPGEPDGSSTAGGPVDTSPDGTGQGETDLRTAAARLRDSDADPETSGDTPRYVDIVAASIVGQGRDVKVQTTFAAELPATMPDGDTFMVVGTRIEGEDRDVYLYVEADSEGWQGYIARGSGGKRAPGTLTVRGASVTLVLPWKALGGAGRFAWYAQSSWTHAGTLRTDYAFDSAPNNERARFPS